MKRSSDKSGSNDETEAAQDPQDPQHPRASLPGQQFQPGTRSLIDPQEAGEAAENLSLAEQIIGEGPRHTAAEVAAETGVSLQDARRVWRALGFPEYGSARAFTDDDVDALQLMIMTVDNGLIDLDTAIALTRALGTTMARLADWEVGTLLQRIESQLPDGDIDARHEAGRELVNDLGEPFERLLLFAWRRHVAAAIARLEALEANEEDRTTHPVTVGFADIVSFTRLSNEMSQDRIGDLVEVFESRCADVVTAQGGRVIKSLGDSVLFVNPEPVAAYDTAEGIIEVIGRDQRMPDVRVGLATGPLVLRLGDVFGPAVNLASRLTGVARRNRIIVDSRTAQALPADQFETRRLPARPLHGFGDVEPLTVRRH